MSEARKRGNFNERVKLAHERKELVEENRRIERMQREAYMTVALKLRRGKSRLLLEFAAALAVYNARQGAY